MSEAPASTTAPAKKEKKPRKGDRERKKGHRDEKGDSGGDMASSGLPEHEDTVDIDDEGSRSARQKRAEAEAEERRKAADAEAARSSQRAVELAAAQSSFKTVSELGIEADNASIDAVKLEPSDTLDQLPPEVFSAFAKLQRFARDLNMQMNTPEIVFIGQRGQGKSSLIESLFGRPFLQTLSGTLRPLVINSVHNASAGEPKCILKRDASNIEYAHDAAINMDNLPAELEKRNGAQFGTEPVVLQFESARVLNATIIDTPGLLLENSEAARAREQLAMKMASPTHRTIVLVRSGVDAGLTLPPGGDYVLELVKQVDPELVRTVVVYTHVHTQIRSFSNAKQANRYLSAGGIPELRAFFVTLPQSVGSLSPDKYIERLLQSTRRDLTVLEQLQFDKRTQRTIGVSNMVKHLITAIWKSYQDSAPRVLRTLRSRRADSERSLREQMQQAESLNPAFFRTVASQYATEFLRTIEHLIAGTAEGNPAVNGQTLEQEHASAGLEAQWADARGLPLSVSAEEWGVPHWQNKLYGGQQFERLLSEFRAVSEHSSVSDISRDDVAPAAGIPKLHNVPNFSWAAADLARAKAQEVFEPLVLQLTERAIHIVKRLPEIAETVISETRLKKSGWQLMQPTSGRMDALNVELYPYFLHFVKDAYNKYVDAVAVQCRARCMDEFYSTRTIFWDLSENSGAIRSESEGAGDMVVELTKKQFNRIKERVTRNVLLKFYNFFLVPLESQLWAELHTRVAELQDKAIEDLFEVNAIRDALKDTETKLQYIIKDFEEKEKLILEAASQFAHPL
jgi:hypothetical protein